MQDNFQQSSMPHYSTATSIDGNGTNEGHCSFTTKYHGQGHTPIEIYPSLSTFLLLTQTQNNKTAIDSNLAESFLKLNFIFTIRKTDLYHQEIYFPCWKNESPGDEL